MKLNEFISLTLTEIVKGIEEASEELKSESPTTKICPSGISIDLKDSPVNKAVYGTIKEGKETKIVQGMTFDVAVTATNNKGLSVKAGGYGLGAGFSSKASNDSVSRISFTIPMILPEPSVKTSKNPE